MRFSLVDFGMGEKQFDDILTESVPASALTALPVCLLSTCCDQRRFMTRPTLAFSTADFFDL